MSDTSESDAVELMDTVYDPFLNGSFWVGCEVVKQKAAAAREAMGK